MTNRPYQICTRCVMDTTDQHIEFDSGGVCNHCIRFESELAKRWHPNDFGRQQLSRIIDKIKEDGKRKEYDCIIGLSGGVDSSYLALAIKDYGLRPLVVHVDAGWNSELAVHNIEQIVKYCEFDLHTHVMDWGEIKDLQLAYLKAGVANQDVVQDHAFFASLYHFATKNKIKYVISGGNIATESVEPFSWEHSAMDSRNLVAIHKKFGSGKVRNFKTISFFDYYFYYPLIKGLTVVRPLNFIPYSKELSIKVLKEKVGYKEYGRKHGESRFTKFFQNHYLPKKFNIDKRRSHLSSLILAKQLTRVEALAELEKPLYDQIELAEDKAYIAKKLGISIQQLESYIDEPSRHYSEFDNWDNLYKLIPKFKAYYQKVFGRMAKSYS